MIRFQCPNCGEHLQVQFIIKDTFVPCPTCKNKVHLYGCGKKVYKFIDEGYGMVPFEVSEVS